MGKDGGINMSTGIYYGRTYWPEYCKVRECVHCGGDIVGASIPIGVGNMTVDGGIQVRGNCCSWPCARAFANCIGTNDLIERLTTIILKDFANTPYHRFSEVPSAPARDQFVRYGGTITYEEYRESLKKAVREKEREQPVHPIVLEKLEIRVSSGRNPNLNKWL